MTPQTYRQLAKRAGQQADVLIALAKKYARLHDSVLATIGGTATGNDRDMCKLLNEAAQDAKFAAQAYAEARRKAEEAATRAEREHDAPTKHGTKNIR